jgi:hypothetical protein
MFEGKQRSHRGCIAGRKQPESRHGLRGGTMKQLIFVAFVAAAIAVPSRNAVAQTGNASLGSVTLSKGVMADGKRLPAGTYQVRLTNDGPQQQAVGESPNSERYVEFVKAGKVAGRELATIVANADIKTVAKTSPPKPGGAKVEMLKGDDYVRVWINRGGTHYIINMPPAT